MRDKKWLIGVSLVALGLFLLLGDINLFQFGWGQLWPVFILLPGLAFELGYFANRRNPGLLVPGGILLTYTALFTFCGIFGYHLMEYLWPVFILGPAIGLFQLYWFGNREKPLMWVSLGLATVALTFISITSFSIGMKYLLPAALIIGGAVMITDKTRGNNKDEF